MMQFPLTLAHIFERALGDALQHMGLGRGDRVATLMWNHHAHL